MKENTGHKVSYKAFKKNTHTHQNKKRTWICPSCIQDNNGRFYKNEFSITESINPKYSRMVEFHKDLKL